jgi:hypothetical protein
MTSAMADPGVGFAGNNPPSSSTVSMAAIASGNSRMILPTASDFGTPGYMGLEPLPMNSARIALRKGLATSPSLVSSEVPEGIEIGGEAEAVDAVDSVLANMGVLTPFWILGSIYAAAGQRQFACKHDRCALTHRTSGRGR